MWGAHGEEGAHGNGGAHGHRGARGKGGRAARGGAHGHRGAQGNWEVRTAKGRVCARPLGWPRPLATWVAWTHTRAPIIGARMGGAHDFKEGPIYVLPSSFEVAKPSPPGSLPNTCKVLCLGLWRLRDLALHT
jgi:hypothetical protein